MDEKKKNGPRDLMTAFSCEGRPVTTPEFSEFWKSLSESEKEFYRFAPLS